MAFPPAIQRALAEEAFHETGTLRDVKHVVILMQENRAFNHYFGTMKGVRGFGDRFPIPLASGKSVWFQSDGTREITPYHLDKETTNAMLIPSTPHSFSDAQAAWNQGKFGFWPKYKNQYSMGYYKRADIPFQFALAEAFTICDAYHCSITTGTDPNRITFWSGSNFNPTLGVQGINSTDADSEPNNLRCWVKGTMPVPGYTYDRIAPNVSFKWDTLPDVLQRAGISWRVYQNPNDNWTGAMHGCLAFESFRSALPGTPIYENGMRNWTLADLTNDVVNGTLPAVSWILPTQLQSEHPGGPSSPIHGGDFTTQVLNALTSNPRTWSKTVLFVTFDENDGLFDHLPPPAVPSYNADGTLAGKSTTKLDGEYLSDPQRKYQKTDDTITGNLRPWGLGPRVPMYVVSPWSKGGWVCSQTFDHTSVGLFLEKRFDLKLTTISPWHRAVCGDLTSAFDFKHPNDPMFPTLPDQSHWAAVEAQQKLLPPPKAPALPQPLFQEVGVRFSRALPYELNVTSRVDARPGAAQIELKFDNSGRMGAVFHVYDRLNLNLIPRRYTVEADKELRDSWALSPNGAYDLWVLGPNGFHRQFTGTTVEVVGERRAKPDVFVEFESDDQQLRLKLVNAGDAPCSFGIVANAYHNAGVQTTANVVARGHTELSLPVRQNGGWYDFTIRVSALPDFVRRIAGRIETGRPSVSDPAMGIQS
jgi:phospholipase C